MKQSVQAEASFEHSGTALRAHAALYRQYLEAVSTARKRLASPCGNSHELDLDSVEKISSSTEFLRFFENVKALAERCRTPRYYQESRFEVSAFRGFPEEIEAVASAFEGAHRAIAALERIAPQLPRLRERYAACLLQEAGFSSEREVAEAVQRTEEELGKVRTGFLVWKRAARIDALEREAKRLSLLPGQARYEEPLSDYFLPQQCEVMSASSVASAKRDIIHSSHELLEALNGDERRIREVFEPQLQRRLQEEVLQTFRGNVAQEALEIYIAEVVQPLCEAHIARSRDHGSRFEITKDDPRSIMTSCQQILHKILVQGVMLYGYGFTDESRELQREVRDLPYWANELIGTAERDFVIVREYLCLLARGKMLSEESGSSERPGCGMAPNLPKEFYPELWHIAATIGNKHFGVSSEITEDCRAAIRKGALETILTSEPHEDPTIKAGYTLFRIGAAEALPLLVLNAFRETGYSGEMPFLQSGKEISLLASTLSALSATEVDNLRSCAIPGLHELVKLVRENPRTFADRYDTVRDAETNALIESPVNVAVRDCVSEMCIHYLHNGTEDEQYFVLAVLEQVASEPSERVTSALVDCLHATEQPHVREEILKTLVNFKGRGASHRGAAHVLREFADEQSKLAKSLGVEGTKQTAALLYTGFLQNDERFLEPSEEVAASLGAIFATSAHHILRHARCLQALVVPSDPFARIPYDSLFDPKGTLFQFEALLTASRDPEAVEVVSQLVAAGYRYDPAEAGALPIFCARKDAVIEELHTLAALGVKEFRPSPVARDAQPKAYYDSPIAEQLSRMSWSDRFQFIASAQEKLGEIPVVMTRAFVSLAQGGAHEQVRERVAAAQEYYDSFVRAALEAKPSSRSALIVVAMGANLIADGFEARDLGSQRESLFTLVERVGVAAIPILSAVRTEWPDETRTAKGLGAALGALLPFCGRVIVSEEEMRQVVNLVGLARRFTQEAFEPEAQIQIVGQFCEEFGARFLPETFTGWLALHRNEPPPEDLRACGVVHSGAQGQSELRSHMHSLLSALLTRDGTLDVKSALDVELLSAVVRFELSQWRQGLPLADIVARYNEARSRTNFVETSQFFTEGSITVERLDAAKLEQFTFSEPCRRRFEQLQADLEGVRGRSSKEVTKRLLPEFSTVLKAHKLVLETPLSGEDAAKDAEGKRARGRAQRASEVGQWVDALDAIAASSAELSIPEVLTSIMEKDRGDVPAVGQMMRRIALSFCLERVPHSIPLEQLSQAPLTPESLGQMAELVQDLVLADGLKQLGIARKSKLGKALQAALSPAALKQDLDRLQRIETAGTEDWMLLATRGLLMEFSANLCDACWAKLREIVAHYPNFTFVPFVRHSKDSDPKIMGGTFLIDAKNEDGERVLVIRGINPQQNHITRIRAESFFEGFLEWLAPRAKAAGFAEIVIPGGASGGAQTNRPPLNAYINDKYGESTVVKLADDPPTAFNGYDIRNSCRRVRDLREAKP